MWPRVVNLVLRGGSSGWNQRFGYRRTSKSPRYSSIFSKAKVEHRQTIDSIKSDDTCMNVIQRAPGLEICDNGQCQMARWGNLSRSVKGD